MADEDVTNQDLDAFLNSSVPEPAEPEPEPTPEAPVEATAEPAPEPEPKPEETRPRDEHGRFAKAEEKAEEHREGHHVPLATFLETRDEVKALKAQIEAYERAQQAAQPKQPEPDIFEDPKGWQDRQSQTYEQRLNERMMAQSVYLAKAQHPDYDAAEGAFVEAAKANPALAQEMWAHPAPAFYAYEQGKKILAQKEIGDDPHAYRERLEAELREKIRAELQQETAQPRQPELPPSMSDLGGSNPVDPKSGYNGPSSLSDILGR